MANNKKSSILSLRSRLRKIKLIGFDLDGTITDGMVYGGQDNLLRAYNVKDGLGLKRLTDSNLLQVVIISAAKIGQYEQICERLGIDEVYQMVQDKAACLQQLMIEHSLTSEQCAFMGDDLPDQGAMQLCGLSFCPADADECIKEIADYCTFQAAGRGAVREICEALLAAPAGGRRARGSDK